MLQGVGTVPGSPLQGRGTQQRQKLPLQRGSPTLTTVGVRTAELSPPSDPGLPSASWARLLLCRVRRNKVLYSSLPALRLSAFLVLIFTPALYLETGTLSGDPSSEHPNDMPVRPSYHLAALPIGQLIRFQLPRVFLLFFLIWGWSREELFNFSQEPD